MWATLPQEHGSDSAPLRYHCPKPLLHGSSPLTRQERSSSSESSPIPSSSTSSTSPNTSRQKFLPPFENIFDAAAEQPPPYQAALPIPHASFYGLVFERRSEITSSDLRRDSNTIPVILDDEDQRYLRSLRELSHGDCEDYSMELDSELLSESLSPPSHRLGPWSSCSFQPRNTLERGVRDDTSLSSKRLDCLRMNFVLQHIPHLANSLRQFENRVRLRAPVVNVFYEWYDQLAVDQRVKHMPYFIPERLDMVQVTSQPAVASAKSGGEPTKTPTVQRKPASFDSPAPEKSQLSRESADMEMDDSVRDRSRSPSPPPAFNAPHEPCDWDEYERIIRWARVLGKRKTQQNPRKEALVRSWTEVIQAMDLAQWLVVTFTRPYT